MTKEIQMIVVAAVIFVSITGGLAWWGMGLSDEVTSRDGAIAALEVTIDKADAEIAKKPRLETEKEALDKHIARYVTILPPPEVASKQSFLRMVQEKCERSQLNARSIVFVAPKLKKKKKAKAKAKGKGKGKKKSSGPAFEEVKVNLEAEGTYDEFLRFLNSIERHETFLRVNTFSCRVIPFEDDAEPTKDDNDNIVWNLEIRLQVSTFTYKTK
ncbi:MAG: hypothetical protein JKY65_01555 [Planctomycetes bacterium]|nr:hypothetical protein [Planctomycetota bacterium]